MMFGGILYAGMSVATMAVKGCFEMTNVPPAKKMNPERLRQVLTRLARERGLRDACAVEVEEGFVLQGLALRSKQNIRYLVLKTQLVDHEELQKLMSAL